MYIYNVYTFTEKIYILQLKEAFIKSQKAL